MVAMGTTTKDTSLLPEDHPDVLALYADPPSEPWRFFDFDGRPAYYVGTDVRMIVPGGEDKRVPDVWSFLHGATNISKAEFDKLKDEVSARK